MQLIKLKAISKKKMRRNPGMLQELPLKLRLKKKSTMRKTSSKTKRHCVTKMQETKLLKKMLRIERPMQDHLIQWMTR